VQAYWLQPTPPPSAAPGMHRAVLNIVAQRGFGSGGRRAVSTQPADACHPAGAEAPKAETAPVRRGRSVSGLQPGTYTVRLTVAGQTLTQPVTVKPDPRSLPRGADASPEDDDDQ
jgi:hypothetical protein